MIGACDSCGFQSPVEGLSPYNLRGRQLWCCKVCADTYIATGCAGACELDLFAVMKTIGYVANPIRKDVQQLGTQQPHMQTSNNSYAKSILP
jgi:hypothetical protein